MVRIDDGVKLPQNRTEFAEFVRGLANSVGRDPQWWDNDTLASYLDACSNWVDDMDGYFINRGEPVPTDLSWSVMARVLLAARSYE